MPYLSETNRTYINAKLIENLNGAMNEIKKLKWIQLSTREKEQKCNRNSMNKCARPCAVKRKDYKDAKDQ